MRVLLDTCVWGGAKDSLADGGHDVLWVGEWTEDPGDVDILKIAAGEGRVLVTLDKDFGELAIVRGMRHGGIVRLVGFPARQQGPACLTVLAKYGSELAAGAIVTVEPSRVRIRLAKSGGSPADHSPS